MTSDEAKALWPQVLEELEGAWRELLALVQDPPVDLVQMVKARYQAGCEEFKGDWTARAESYREAIAEALERTVMPGLRESIVTSLVMTPQDFQDRLLSYKGAAFGLEPLLLQSAYFRPHNRSEDVDGLFMVGAGTHPGAGLPGVLSSAKALESVLPDPATMARR